MVLYLAWSSRRVKLAARGPDMSCVGHAHSSSAKTKNIVIHHNPACDKICFATRGLGCLVSQMKLLLSIICILMTFHPMLINIFTQQFPVVIKEEWREC